jgi:hypothetical protein
MAECHLVFSSKPAPIQSKYNNNNNNINNYRKEVKKKGTNPKIVEVHFFFA